MTLQQKIAHENAAAKIGTELKLLVDQPLVARTEADAPEVDTRVLLSQPGPVGEFIIREIRVPVATTSWRSVGFFIIRASIDG